MSLNLYLDDCADSGLLADLLRQAGHHVVRPRDAALDGVDDEVHFSFAANNALTLITKNPADFENLHNFNANHAGIVAIYRDNDPHDMSEAEIVKAIANLEIASQMGGKPIQGRFHSLNDWRY